METYLSKCGKEITIDLNRDELLTEAGVQVLKDRYLLEDEQSPQEAFARAACAFGDDEAHAQRLYDYASKRWFMFSTPVLCNGGTERGLPISCFLSYADDSCEGLAENYKEDIMISRNGGGIGTYFGAIRSVGQVTSKGNRTTGLIPFLKVVDSLTMAFQQGSNRRGAAAVYIDINHPEIENFIEIRKTSRSADTQCSHLHHGVNITDDFMEALKDPEAKFPLKDPHSGETIKEVSPRDLWTKLLLSRVATGEPYLHFIDTANKALPLPLKLRGLKINTSNLCSEIELPTSPDRTAVCCLSSVNLETFDEWQGDDMFIEDLIRMLDNVLQNFIDTAPPELWRAVNSATLERSLGLGAMGFHAFLQKNMIPFEGVMAAVWNKKMFQNIQLHALNATEKLAKERGEAPDMKGTGRRNAHLMAIAPNASSSIICGSSPSIEPNQANSFTQQTESGTFIMRNKYLKKLLQEKGMDTPEVWYEIGTVNKGSVRSLDFLSDHEKDVFKCALEIDQNWIVEHASNRQHFIDQGQSVNLFFEPTAKMSYLHSVHKKAFDKGLKALYYCRSKSSISSDVGGLNLDIKKPKEDLNMNKESDDECLSCQG